MVEETGRFVNSFEIRNGLVTTTNPNQTLPRGYVLRVVNVNLFRYPFNYSRCMCCGINIDQGYLCVYCDQFYNELLDLFY